jgi:LmbE family N-acetylglucosaminyl deacetylase
MSTALPLDTFKGTIVIVAPHMDDEALACGGLIAMLPQKECIHLIYATDGTKSPAPIVPGRDAVDPDLGEIRVRESISAMRHLGVPETNLHFLRLSEGELSKYNRELEHILLKAILNISPDTLVIPFRYDRHPDHLAINRIVMDALKGGLLDARIVEYFIYYRSRLLPLRDIRKYIHPKHLIQLDIKDVADKKRKALDQFTSQTTFFYSWQTRPILTPSLLDQECQNPEYFLLHDSSYPGAAVFTKSVLWIRIAHRIEPHLQKWKYLGMSYVKRLIGRSR